jgi:hypothetical protein
MCCACKQLQPAHGYGAILRFQATQQGGHQAGIKRRTLQAQLATGLGDTQGATALVNADLHIQQTKATQALQLRRNGRCANAQVLGKLSRRAVLNACKVRQQPCFMIANPRRVTLAMFAMTSDPNRRVVKLHSLNIGWIHIQAHAKLSSLIDLRKRYDFRNRSSK